MKLKPVGAPLLIETKTPNMHLYKIMLPVLLIFLNPQWKLDLKAEKPPLIPDKVCLSTFEAALYEELIAYRAAHQLPAIPLSASLTLVAQVHCHDLAVNQPHISEKCNMHSWSRKGPWSACCYTPDHKKASCMWDKPRELTQYKGDGYEIAFYSTAYYPDATSFAKDAFESWSRSKGHNDVILNRGTWKKLNWNAVGVGFHGEYATIWFGVQNDPDATAITLCE